ncbi:DUF3012 domain-containing protein [Endozoicomonas atrinae]|uniref:DUF3012 domain-containing protein n=1 Tax=Endozoicomonas atrinae TaxID=1333660 RepID=UPI0009F4FCF4|nr:DUF3012 domain-containing protein [Endozoicomonas atrinae]
MKRLSGVFLVVFLLAGCSPEIGSEAWCNDLKEKPKGDWTANEAADFAKHCVFK